jgi:hypothetical protein
MVFQPLQKAASARHDPYPHCYKPPLRLYLMLFYYFIPDRGGFRKRLKLLHPWLNFRLLPTQERAKI